MLLTRDMQNGEIVEKRGRIFVMASQNCAGSLNVEWWITDTTSKPCPNHTDASSSEVFNICS